MTYTSSYVANTVLRTVSYVLNINITEASSVMTVLAVKRILKGEYCLNCHRGWLYQCTARMLGCPLQQK